jgi:hypothetical protein
MTLLSDLEAFVYEHRSHGGMTGDATAVGIDDDIAVRPRLIVERVVRISGDACA